jgi:hypothetical protein
MQLYHREECCSPGLLWRGDIQVSRVVPHVLLGSLNGTIIASTTGTVSASSLEPYAGPHRLSSRAMTKVRAVRMPCG